MTMILKKKKKFFFRTLHCSQYLRIRPQMLFFSAGEYTHTIKHYAPFNCHDGKCYLSESKHLKSSDKKTWWQIFM
jgi:hypothetical protein